MTSNNQIQTLRLFAGSVALALLAQDVEAKGCSEKFRKLRSQIRERLETYPNIKIIKDIEKDSDLSFRYPRIWQPSGIEDDLKAGYWVFPEFQTPIIFQFHLPRKLQNAVFSGAGDDHNIEDIWIAYDGMIFVGACEIQADDHVFWLQAMVRKYLQTELFKSIGDCRAVVIPPSPMHVDVELEFETKSGAVSKRQEVDWDPQYRRLTVRSSQTGEIGTGVLLESYYRRMQAPLRLFYHVEIDKSIADDLHGKILSDVAATYRDYEESLDLAPWNLIQRWKAQGELSRKIGGIQYSFCEHALALSRVHDAEGSLYRELRLNPLMMKSEEYFRSMTEPESLSYELFRGTLEHIRSHVFVLSQNKYLIYAALVGSFITLLGTIVGYFIHH